MRLEAQIGHRTIGHHHILAVQSLLIACQVRAQDLAVWMGASDAVFLDYDHAAGWADQFLGLFDAIILGSTQLVALPSPNDGNENANNRKYSTTYKRLTVF